MKRTFTLLLTTMAVMFYSLMASGIEFRGTSEQYPKATYSTENVEFALSEVAEALGTDTMTLNAGLADGSIKLSIVYTDEDGVLQNSTEYSTNTTGFWMTQDGARTTWGIDNGSMWYADMDWNEADNLLFFMVGQYPSQLNGTESFTAHLQLTYGEAVADFYVTLQMKERPNYGDLTVDAFTVVKTAEVSITQDARTNTMTDHAEVDIADAAQLLGFTEDELNSQFGFIVHAVAYDPTTDWMKPEVTPASDWEAPSFYFLPLIDENTGELSPFCVAGDDGNLQKFFISNMQYADGKLKFDLGQVAGKTVPGEHLYTNLYLVKDGKAYVVKVNLDITDAVLLTPANMTCVGGDTLIHEYSISDPAAADYLEAMAKQRYTIDINAILALFPEGATVADLIYMTTEDSVSGRLTDALTSSDGFYMDWNGVACAWGAAEMRCKVGYSGSSQYVNFAYTGEVPEEGAQFNGSVYLVYKNQYYYEFNLLITLKGVPPLPEYVELTAADVARHQEAGVTIYTHDAETDTYVEFLGDIEEGGIYYVQKESYIEPAPEYTFETCETVAEPLIDVQLVLCESSRTLQRYNAMGESDAKNIVTDLDEAFIMEQLGTTSPAYYVTVKTVTEAGLDSISYHLADASFSSQSLSGNNGGAWLSKDGYFGDYGADFPIGFSHLGCQIEWWKYSAWTDETFQVGERDTVSFYVANVAQGKRIKYTFAIEWIEKYYTAEIVGTQDLVLAARGDGDEPSLYEFDMSEVAGKFGVTAEEIEYAEVWYGINSNRSMVELTTDYYDETDGIALDADGYAVNLNDADALERIVLFVKYSFEEGGFTAYVIDDVNIDTDYHTTLYLDYDGKRYQFNITVTKDPAALAIEEVSHAMSSPTIYSIAGQRQDGLKRGINIVGGKKIFVK